MPSISKKQTKSGKEFYEIRVRRGRDKSTLSKRWYPPEGWSKRAVDRELQKVAAEFQRQCTEGEIRSGAELREEKAQRELEEAQILTLREYGEQVYMPAKTITMSENSRAGFQHNLDHYIYPVLGDQKITTITSAQITKLLLNVQKEGKACSTVGKIHTVLKGVFKMAYMGDVIDRNPMDKVERPKPRKDEVKGTVAESLTIQELCRVLDCLEQEPLIWRAMIRLLIDTGIRRGECCGLRWDYVDFKHATITIAANLCYTPRKGVYLDTTKNSKIRTIDVDPEVMMLLKALKQEQRKTVRSEFVFAQHGSAEPIHPQSPTRYLHNFSKKYSLPDIHPHLLRHSFASVAITHGADIASVSEKLGHSDKAVTLRMYTHANSESIRRAGSIFRAAIYAEQEKENRFRAQRSGSESERRSKEAACRRPQEA